MTVVPVRLAGRKAEDRDLVDRGRDVGRAELDGAQRPTIGRAGRRSARRRRRRRGDVPGRSARPLLDVGAHRAQDVDHRAPGRVDADVAEAELGIGVDRRPRRARTPPPRRRPGPVPSSSAQPTLPGSSRPPSHPARPSAGPARPAPATSAPCDRESRSTREPSSPHPPAAPPAGSPTSPVRSAPTSRRRWPGAGYDRSRSVEEGSRSIGREARRPSSAAVR